MALLRSAPDGFTTLGRRRAVIGFGLTWATPGLVAAAALILQRTLGTPSWGDGWLWLYAASSLALISPAFTWFGLILAAPLTAILMDRGWFGWLPAVTLGITIGATLGWLGNTTLALPIATVSALILRATLARLAPSAF